MVHRAELLHAQHFSEYYQRQPASPALQHSVDHFWLLKSYQALGDAVSESHFPRLASEWVFVHQPKPDAAITHAPGFFAGVRPPLRQLTPFIYAAHTVAFGVRFQPGVSPDLQSLSLEAQQAVWQMLSHCQPATAEHCLQQLVQSVEPLLTKHITSGNDEVLGVCQQALFAFKAPEATVEHVAYNLGVTPRTLRRYFQGLWGISPKQAQRQVRLREALKHRWQADIHGDILHYYGDHSHFYKSFRQVCQVSLQQFLKLHGA